MKKKELRDRNGLTEAEFLSSYEPGDYVRPSVAADMVIFTVIINLLLSFFKLILTQPHPFVKHIVNGRNMNFSVHIPAIQLYFCYIISGFGYIFDNLCIFNMTFVTFCVILHSALLLHAIHGHSPNSRMAYIFV